MICLPETVGRLAEIENIIGIKEATGDLQRGREVLDICAGRMAVYSGDDETAAELILMGAKGNVSVTANVAPALMAQLCDWHWRVKKLKPVHLMPAYYH